MLHSYVSEACDRLEYKNSPMYDECPDELMINRLCDTICDTVISVEGLDNLRKRWDIYEKDEKLSGTEIEEEKAPEMVEEAATLEEELFLKVQETGNGRKPSRSSKQTA